MRGFSLLSPLGHLQGSPGAEQLEQIVGETYQFPFRPHLLQSAQQEPSEPTPLFDLPEHRFQVLLPGGHVQVDTLDARLLLAAHSSSRCRR
jgi:hypothetical protein